MAQAGVFQRERLPICKAVQVGYESDPSAAAEIKQLEEKLIGQSRQLRDQVNSWVAPWRSKWQAADGWTDKLAMLNAAHDRGLEKGVETWTQDQVSFLQEVVQFGEEAGKWVEGQGEEAVSWYSDLSLVEKVFWPVALGDEAADKITKELGPLAKEWQTLWDNRQHILTLFKALVSNSVNAVQLAIEALAKMSGEVGELMQLLWDKGDDWVQALIETCRETRAIQVVFSTLGAIAAAFPPNLWVEAASTAAGYVLPEILIAVILAIIAALSDGAAAPLLVARITSYVAKVKRMVTKMGDLGELLLKVFDGIKPLAETITQLVKALWKNIAEKVDGVLGDVRRIVRRSERHEIPDIRSIRARRGLVPDSLEDAENRLRSAGGLIKRNGHEAKYSDAKLQRMAKGGEVAKERYHVRFMDAAYLQDRKTPDIPLSGKLGGEFKGKQTGIKYWSTTFDQIEDVDTDPLLATQKLGIPDNGKPKAMILVDNEKAAEIAGTHAITPTFEGLGNFAKEQLSNKISPELIDKAFTPDYQASYHRLFQQAQENGIDLWDKKSRKEFLAQQGADPELFKARLTLHDKLGSNEDFLGDGLTKNLMRGSRNQHGAVESFTFEHTPQNLAALQQAGAIRIIHLPTTGGIP